MSQAAFNIFDALSAWSKTLSNWQRCLLVKLVGDVDFPDEALDEVYREYLMDQQLAIAEVPRAAWDIALPQTEVGASTAASVMSAMTALTGINALAAGETLTFGRKLTVIYGPNGAGKSGYARVLKAACFTRSKQTGILGDVKLAKHQTQPPALTDSHHPIPNRPAQDTSVPCRTGALNQFKGSSKKPAGPTDKRDRQVVDTRFTRKSTAVHTSPKSGRFLNSQARQAASEYDKVQIH